MPLIMSREDQSPRTNAEMAPSLSSIIFPCTLPFLCGSARSAGAGQRYSMCREYPWKSALDPTFALPWPHRGTQRGRIAAVEPDVLGDPTGCVCKDAFL